MSEAPVPRAHRALLFLATAGSLAILVGLYLTSVAGPAILEQPDTTILVETGFVAQVDSFGNLVIERS